MTLTAGSMVVAAVVVLAMFATVAVCGIAALLLTEFRSRHGISPPVGGSYGLECPNCGASPGRPCRRVDGVPMASAHEVRRAAAGGLVRRDEAGNW